MNFWLFCWLWIRAEALPDELYEWVKFFVVVILCSFRPPLVVCRRPFQFGIYAWTYTHTRTSADWKVLAWWSADVTSIVMATICVDLVACWLCSMAEEAIAGTGYWIQDERTRDNPYVRQIYDFKCGQEKCLPQFVWAFMRFSCELHL